MVNNILKAPEGSPSDVEDIKEKATICAAHSKK